MQLKQLSLFITITIWATLIGGILYSHIVFFPAYLSNLPESTRLIQGTDGLHDENFWMAVHPAAILFTIITLVLHWKHSERRRLILISASIYAMVILVTGLYFVPGLLAFAESHHSELTSAQWYDKGQTWQHFSWIRGTFMCTGFITLLVALTKTEKLPKY